MSESYPQPGKEFYLGDGLYASFDGWHIRLRAPRESNDHWVALEPQVWQALHDWIRQYPELREHLGERADG